MTRFGLSAAVLAAGVLLWSSSARANTIHLNGAQNSGPVSFPPTFQVLDSGPSPLTFSSPPNCCPNNSVKVTASGTPPGGSGSLFSNALIHSNGTTPRTLFLWITETGITAPLGTDQFHSSFTANDFVGPISSITLSTFLNPSDRVSPVVSRNGEDLLGTVTFTGGGIHSTTHDEAVTGPYALVELYEITTTGSGATPNLTINLTTTSTTVIPEPATLSLLGTSLVGIAALRRRRGPA